MRPHVHEPVLAPLSRSASGEEARQRRTHWSGVVREADGASAKGDDESAGDDAARRQRMNHLRRCNEDMRILMLGWTCEEVGPGKAGAAQRIYTHPVHGTARSKKEIFRMHRGEKLDFSSAQASVLSERVRELRAHESSTVILSGCAGAEERTAGGHLLDDEVEGQEDRDRSSGGAVTSAAPEAPPSLPSGDAAASASAFGSKRPLTSLDAGAMDGERTDAEGESLTSPMTCGKRPAKHWGEALEAA